MVNSNELNILVQAKIDPQAAILRLLREAEEEYFNIQKIADYLEISRPTVAKHCRNLVSKDKVGEVKEGRSVLYYAKEQTNMA